MVKDTGVWNTILCTNELCRSKTSTCKWRCTCGGRWLACPVHSKPGLLCGTTKIESAGSLPKDLAERKPPNAPGGGLKAGHAALKRKRGVEVETAPRHSGKRKALTPTVSWFSDLPKLSPRLYDKFPQFARAHAQDQDVPFHHPDASSSSAPPRKRDPG